MLFKQLGAVIMLSKLQRPLVTLAIICLSINLTACFKFRSKKDLPVQLDPLHLDVPKNQLSINEKLTYLFTSLGITLTQHAKQAPYTLRVSHIRFHYSDPALLTTQTAVHYTFTLSCEAALYWQNGMLAAGPRSITAEQTLIANVGELYLPTAVAYNKDQLEREVVGDIFNWLESVEVHKAVAKAPPYNPIKAYPSNRIYRKKEHVYDYATHI